MTSLDNFRHRATQVRSVVQHEEANIARLKSKIILLEEHKKQLIKAVGVIDKVIDVISASGIGKIESIVSAGLQIIWPTLWFVVEKKEGTRGNSYRLLLRKGNVSGPPMDTFGGGPVNVAAFLLRVIMIKRFKLAKFLAVDEGFNNVSESHLAAVNTMLTKLCEDFGFTILAVTHQQALAASATKTYEVFPGPVLTQGPIDVSAIERHLGIT